MRSAAYILVAMLAALAQAGCGKSASVAAVTDDAAPRASLLAMQQMPDSSWLVEITNPWDTAAVLQRLQLVPRGRECSPIQGAVRLEVPVRRSVVFSSVHAGAVAELQAVERIKGVADGRYFLLPQLRQRLAVGSIVDVGSSMNPSVETVVGLEPDVILVSPYQNAGLGPLEHVGVPIVQMADYMEPTPLARAEWIKLIGVLYGDYPRAEAAYRRSVSAYDSLAAIAATLPERPKVITESVQSGVWMVPGGASYKARMLADAGGSYPWADSGEAGSLQLDFPMVFERASDADCWIITTYGYDLTLERLRADYPLNARIKAAGTGEVYGADTSVTSLFDEFPFHPERLLRDYMLILHPQLSERLPGGLRYFKKAQ